MIPCHYAFMAQQLVDSRIGTTRAFWRGKVGHPQHANDPRPLAECIADPDLDRTLSAVNDAMKEL